MKDRLGQRLHQSWLIGWCGLGLVAGVSLAPWLEKGFFAGSIWLVAGLALLVLGLVKNFRYMVLAVVLAGLMIGLWRGNVGQAGLEVYDSLISQSVELSGRVLEDPDLDKRSQTVLRLTDIRIGGQDLPGRIWVVTAKNDDIRRSDIIAVKGVMRQGFGNFSAQIYRAEVVNIERPVPGDVMVGVRDWFAGRVQAHLPETEAALAMGFLTGLRRALPPDLIEALKIAGLTHVIVASGYNLTILVRFSRRLFVRISKYLATLSSSVMIIGFMMMTGMSPSMSRAGLVAGLSLAVWYYGRKVHPLVLLPLAAAVTLLINPEYAWGDLGWQLSFAAFAGVMLLAPLLQRYFFGEKKPGAIRQVLGETLSAQVMTLPILILNFGVVSNVALITNLLIVPLVPLAMLLTFMLGVVSGLPVVANLLAIPTEWLLKYMVTVADWLAGQTWAQSEVTVNWWQALAIYAAIFLGMFWIKRQTKLNFREANIVE